MAENATIYKINLQLSDLTHNKYGDFPLTIALHPSETIERMMLRVLAFALNANEALKFTKGICVDDEPDLWQKSLSGEIDYWIELGLLDEKRIKKGCNRAKSMTLYVYGMGDCDHWWAQIKNKLTKFKRLNVFRFTELDADTLEAMAERTFNLQCTIDDHSLWLSTDNHATEVNVTQLN